jgi:hypothetical protein
MEWGLSIISADNENTIRYWRNGNSTFAGLPGNGNLKDSLEQGLPTVAEKMGLDNLRGLFRGQGIIGLSTSYFLDLVREGKGQKIGIVLNEKSLDALSEEEKQYLPLTGDNITYISPSEAGPDHDEVIKAYRDLLKVGVHSVVVALKSSPNCSEHERQIRDLLHSEYPSRYLGSVPIYISSDFKTEDADIDARDLSILNAYGQAGMRSYFFDTEQSLKALGYRGALHVGNRYGNISRWDQTRAIDTSDSVFRSAISGARVLTQKLGIEQALVLHADSHQMCLGAIKDGAIRESRNGTVMGIPISAPSAEGISVKGSSVSTITEAAAAYISDSGLDAKVSVLIPASNPAVSLCTDAGSALGVKEVYTAHSSGHLGVFGLSGMILNQFFRTGDADMKGLADPDIILGDD